VPAALGHTGCDLTSLFGDNALTHADAVKISLPYKKHTWLPVLTVLFLLSYGLMTMLIVEQGATIESQRVLIRELFRDSSELSAVKGKAVVDKNAADAKRRAQSPSANTQSPSQDAANQSAANQAAQQHRAPKKQQWTAPTRPAADLADDRRALITI
jgi:hypothetical protein